MSQEDKATDGPPTTGASSEAELARAFRELARGEQQAAAMEANLSKLEGKLDALLAQFEAAAGSSVPEEKESNGDGKTTQHGKDS